MFPKNKPRGISGSTLKMIAMVSMLIDHIGAAVFENLLWTGDYFLTHSSFLGLSLEQLFFLDRVHRWIGRLAFPIFCFLLIEGFFIPRVREILPFACLCLLLCRRFLLTWLFLENCWS